MTWISAHLYYNPPQESMLIEAVKPWLAKLSDTGVIQRYFFIHYGHKGIHIRLRLQLRDAADHAFVEEETKIHFENYFQKHPSIDIPIPHESFVYPNNSIQFIPYEPETGRYGGPMAIGIAEDQFKLSTDIVLDILSATNEWDYSSLMGCAIKMHIAFMFAMKESAEMLERFCWYAVDVLAFSGTYSRMMRENAGYSMHKEFENLFKTQESAIMPVLLDFWDDLVNNTPQEPWIQPWLSGMDGIFNSLNELNLQQSLSLIDQYRYKKNLWNQEDMYKWSIYASYVHMTNNRLGIKVVDEPYVLYIVNRFFFRVRQEAAQVHRS